MQARNTPVGRTEEITEERGEGGYDRRQDGPALTPGRSRDTGTVAFGGSDRQGQAWAGGSKGGARRSLFLRIGWQEGVRVFEVRCEWEEA